MTDLVSSDFLMIFEVILAVGVGWIILRFLFKLARKIFAFGCFAIVIVGIILLASQLYKGM
jgi:hypothetical protein